MERMPETAALLERREELKRALDENNNRTLVDRLLDGASRPFRRLIGTQPALFVIFGTVIISLITIFIGILLAGLFGEFGILQQLARRFGWWMVPLLITSTVSMTVANAFLRRMITIFREHLLDLAETEETLEDIESWIRLVYSIRLPLLPLLVGVVGGILAGAALVYNLNSNLGLSIGIGFTVMVILFAMQSTLFIGALSAILFLTMRMRRYQLALFPSDPGNSQIINILSRFLSNFVYLFAGYGAFITYSLIATGLWIVLYSVLPIFWVLIVLIFAINQYSLAQIIQRAKWKTLNAVQTKVEDIQQEQAVPNKEARETILWLLDYHDRVKATRNSALNVQAGFSLFNSLLLPVLAFLLGNLDTILALLR
jgi:hypothetical protein